MPKNLIPFIIIGVIIAAGFLGVYFILNQSIPAAEIKKNTEEEPMKFIQEEKNNQNTNTQNPVASPTSSVTELIIEDEIIGQGAEVKSGDTIVMHYTGTLENGQKFDSSVDRGQPFETQIGVGQVIKGWDEGVIGMKVGGKRKLTIPGSLAYGEQGIPGAIPSNATLIFELELLDIK
ncbi:MAG: FKBP-type peptidyl-prolyl cis-trans isomerase [Patescibacteria group bacterium]